MNYQKPLFFFKAYYGPGMRLGIGSKIIGLLMLPFILLMIPVVLVLAVFSMRRLIRSMPQPQRPTRFVDSDNVITVPKIEK